MSFLERVIYKLENVIKSLANKKLREEDIGKKREFIVLLMEFNKVYERKTIEEADYKAKIKNSIERSCLPTSTATCRFERMVTRK